MPLDNDDIKQLIAILQKGLSSDSEKDESVAETVEKPRRKRGKIPQINTALPKSTTRNKKLESSNRFDLMMEKNLHKEDLEVDKLLSKYPPTIRSREFTPVEVKCRVCGTEDSINPALMNDAPNRYKCNRCSKEPG
jgi:hypothetical protein